MFWNRVRPIGLRTHAFVLSTSLFTLITILGFRAYRVAENHIEETRSLISHDMSAETLLNRMESLTLSRDQANKKFQVSHDRMYLDLSQHYKELFADALTDLRHHLGSAYKDLAQAELSVNNPADIEKLRLELEARRNERLGAAKASAIGLMRLILLAVILTVGVTAWLVYLFQYGLMEPLRKLREATNRIQTGDLTHRLAPRGGVAELRELTRSFNSMAERLETLDKAKNDFLATMSHEIKNPLAALKEGLGFMAAQGDNLTPPARNRIFGACLIASKRIESMFNNLLKLSQGEAGLFDFEFTSKNLRDAVQSAIEEVRPLALKRGMTLKFEAPEELKASFNWDGIVQVFENLLLNAIKYGSEGSVIEVNAKNSTRPIERANTSGELSPVPHAEFSVSNQGKPVSAGEISRIFERFYRASNSEKQQGLGIGLHVVKRIIEAHHGGVTASSEDGRTQIRVWIPSQYESQSRYDKLEQPVPQLSM